MVVRASHFQARSRYFCYVYSESNGYRQVRSVRIGNETGNDIVGVGILFVYEFPVSWSDKLHVKTLYWATISFESWTTVATVNYGLAKNLAL
jgi:hypothetical protein